MDALRIIALLLQEAAQPVGHKLGVGKDDNAVILVRVQQIQQAVFLVLAIGLNDILGNLRLVFGHGLYGDFHRLVLILPANGHYILIGSGREHHQLTILWGGLDDGGDVLDKAHLEHLVRLVDHHGVHAVHARQAAVHHIQHTAGRSHHNLRLALELLHLLGNGLTAVQRSNARLGNIACQGGEFLGNLHSQLTGRGDNQLLNVILFQLQILQHRDAEGAGFACARRGDGNDVVARHHHGYGARLHRGHSGEAHFCHRPQHLAGDIQRVKTYRFSF